MKPPLYCAAAAFARAFRRVAERARYFSIFFMNFGAAWAA
jgi:hypothetical protein